MIVQYAPSTRVRTVDIVEEDNSGSANGTFCYYLYLTIEGSWLLQRKEVIDAANGIYSWRYASMKNNASYQTISTAWTARASLTYNYLNVVIS